jgi:hypothetical protein
LDLLVVDGMLRAKRTARAEELRQRADASGRRVKRDEERSGQIGGKRAYQAEERLEPSYGAADRDDVPVHLHNVLPESPERQGGYEANEINGTDI